MSSEGEAWYDRYAPSLSEIAEEHARSNQELEGEKVIKEYGTYAFIPESTTYSTIGYITSRTMRRSTNVAVSIHQELSEEAAKEKGEPCPHVATIKMRGKKGVMASDKSCEPQTTELAVLYPWAFHQRADQGKDLCQQ